MKREAARRGWAVMHEGIAMAAYADKAAARLFDGAANAQAGESGARDMAEALRLEHDGAFEDAPEGGGCRQKAFKGADAAERAIRLAPAPISN